MCHFSNNIGEIIFQLHMWLSTDISHDIHVLWFSYNCGMKIIIIIVFTALYRKIVSYVLLRSGLGSPTDIGVVREATGKWFVGWINRYTCTIHM